ncbi:choline dehydrogenase [Thalassomonas viridans]|uniref:Choline dehydrogenase n=1 Tax=Thalassomonas viridans TaxID=137584 RepID=A0AAE9Z785_9GAMM|nr:choline dehydrogenase [Thalassomonas viridans]WDE06563.1 choline dehydrogenase [Thalassomonas viridans]
MKTYDFIIVGAGSAGCVLAERLSACGKYKVCLLEGGPKDNHWSIQLPLGVIGLMTNRALNWQYQSVQEASLNRRRVFNPRGKTLGGSSSINAMLYIRGQKEDYDHWAELGNPGWSFDEVLPYFKAMQHQERGPDDYHGTGGPLNVADSRSKLPVNEDFIQAAQQAGFPLNPDFNGPGQEGIGYYQVTQKDGYRCSAAKAFLTPHLGRKNLRVLTGVRVEKLQLSGKQVTGLSYLSKGKRYHIKAANEVLLSAGAFNSPQLLMLSGIGPENELKQHNIEVKHALEGVGQNLQDHVDVLVVNRHKRYDLLSFRPRAILWAIRESWKFIRERRGLLTSSVCESGGFIKSHPNISRPDLQFHFIPGAMDDHGRNRKMLLNYGIALHVCLLRPKSRGKVGLYGNKACLHPKIELNMLDDKEDMEKMTTAVKIAREVLAQSPLSDNNGQELIPGSQCQSDDDIRAFLQQKANTIYHPVGTCKMGQDKLAVVDASLKVHGLQGLRVVDASIMPTIISGNTNAPTMMIAAKAADMILQSHNS